MSWSVTMMGTPPKVAEALREYANTLTGQSREEYEAAMPHLVALVEQNASPANPHAPGYQRLVHLQAGGHGSRDKDGNWVERNCAVTLSNSFTKLLV